MIYFVFEIEFERVVNFKSFEDYLEAEEYAKMLCWEEGIDFQGDVSVDDDFCIQIFTKG